MDEQTLFRRLRATNPDALWDSVVSVAPRNPAEAKPTPREPIAPPDPSEDDRSRNR
jgi:hypothetical protein